MDPVKRAREFNQRGLAAMDCSQFDAAAEFFRNATVAVPHAAGAHNNLGFALFQLGRYQDAIRSYERAVAIQPNYAAAYDNRANALYRLQSFDAAVVSYDAAIAINPDYPGVHRRKGLALMKLGRYADALRSFDQEPARHRDDPEAYFDRGNALLAMKQYEAATVSFDAAIRLDPGNADAFNNRGTALQRLGKPDAALSSFNRALEIKPDYGQAFANRGVVMLERNNIEAALTEFDTALVLDPSNAGAHCGRAYACLLGGDFEKGWLEQEWRWDDEESPLSRQRRRFSEPLWLGRQSIAGCRLLLHGEQGFGDTLQFSRYAALVAGLGATVILEVPASLVRLLSSLAGVSEVLAAGRHLPAFDYHCPLMSLPLAFGTRLETIPLQAQYLRAAPEDVARWKARLGERKQPRVGLAWSGNSAHQNDTRRTIPLSQWLQHLPEGLQFVSLQRDVRASDRPALEGHPRILDFSADLRDFSDTAALCECLDLVISVDTSAAHLSGSLGRRTWLLLPFHPDWRWLLGREDSPWYPTFKLYRQPAPGDWNAVFRSVSEDLLRVLL